MDTLRPERLVGELVEAYVDWRESCARLDDAYRTSANETAAGIESPSRYIQRRLTRKSRPPISTPSS